MVLDHYQLWRLCYSISTTTTALVMTFIYNPTYPKVRQEGLNLSPTLPPLPLNQPQSMLLALSSLVSQHPSCRFDSPQQQQHQNQNPITPGSLYIHDELSFLTSSTRSIFGTPSAAHFGLGTRCPWPVFVYTR